MQWTSLNDLREKYLSFFESKGHLRLNSFSLVPNNDKSLLLINSGMAPMKKYFTGEITPPRKRVTTCQKCIRTPDLERVGHTARHGTYFEMLGNFSFGDYFKHEAIPWAWEFLTEVLEIPAEKLWPSVYEQDDEAYNIWLNDIGVPAERIVKLGKEDNFWEHGTGPCGPCSEIYFDRGEKYGCGSEDCKPGCDCDRYMEIWNNVFTQFNNMGDGTYEELDHKNIDTGMGLERLACVMQGVDNMFEVDTIRKILDKVCEISGKEYGKSETNDVSIRAITDHARAATFMISDGIIPSNEGRGYVLRRLIRRASRHGKLLGIKDNFLLKVVDVVIAENKAGYPELVDKKDLIYKVISNEETAFSKTIDQGLNIIDGLIKKGGTVSGEDAFRLYDTFGFPLDLTKDILSEKGLAVDEETFNKLMLKQKETARNARKASDGESWKSDGVAFDNIAKTEFTGYTENKSTAKILAIVADGESVNTALNTKVIIVLDKTPFYAESGGQVGDTGVIKTANGTFTVNDTKKNASDIFMHFGTLTGTMNAGDTVEAEIDVVRRDAIRRNHTAAHLLQAALRKVLGTHVEQAGQLVNEKEVRFDFTHFSALNSEELEKVEDLVNETILSAIPVENTEMPIEEAKKLGAMALFGEKYGERVRVVKAQDKSVEFCGGTHVDNTSKIGLFRIVSEASVAAGIRRIEAVTGENVLKLLKHYNNLLTKTAELLKCNTPEDVLNKASGVVADLKDREKQIEKLEAEKAAGRVAELIKDTKQIGSLKLITKRFKNVSADEIKNMAEKMLNDYADTVTVLAAENDGKIAFCASCGKDAVKSGAMAGKIVKEVALIASGNGGGRPDIASAGGKDVTKIDEALKKAEEVLIALIGG